MGKRSDGKVLIIKKLSRDQQIKTLRNKNSHTDTPTDRYHLKQGG